MPQRRTPHAQNVLVPSAFETRSFAQTAVGLLREMILSGGYGPGERLNELAISEQLQISRSPIREALQTLAGQGLVHFIPGRGAFVTDFDIDSIRELGELRIALESRAARLAASRATSAQLNEIRLILTHSEKAIRSGEIDDLLDYSDRTIQSGGDYPQKLDFHQAVLNASHNQRLVDAADTAATQFRLARARTGREAAWAAEAHEEHRVIVEALERHDPETADVAMEEHLANSVSRSIAHIEATSGT